MQFFGDAFVGVSVIGLVIGVFELAFHQATSMQQLVVRVAIHVASIPAGAYLRTLQYVEPKRATLHHSTQLLLSSCLLAVGSIGLVVAAVELGIVVFGTPEIYYRIGIYAACLVVGISTTTFESASFATKAE